jgi:2-iminobutanoate/2-iminopropanoate deaminase
MMGQRRGIYVGGQGHGANPIPAASMKGGLLASGAVYGAPPKSSESIGMDRQCETLFANIDEILRAAGGSFEDVIHVAISLADPSDRKLLNEHWLRAFPDPASRPARHVHHEAMPPGSRLIAAEFLAVIDER